jgi:hypothetical protein
MKTTLDLNDVLLIHAKSFAAQQRTTLTKLIEEGLELRLHRRLRPARKKKLSLPVFAGKGGLCDGLNGLSNRAFWDAADHDA